MTIEPKGSEREVVHTVFGYSVYLPEIRTGLMLVCVNRGGGWEPKKVLLPHQLYVQDIAKWRQEQPDIRQVVAFPVDHESFVTVWDAAQRINAEPER